jgi:hypothetical protein
MASSMARDRETVGRGDSLAAGGRSRAGDMAMADRVRMWRILVGSGGTSAAHSQKAAHPRQFSGQGQDAQGSAPCRMTGGSTAMFGGLPGSEAMGLGFVRGP